MEAYAVIETGGKQYRVSKGMKIVVEKLEGEAESSIAIDKVLAFSDGKALSVGTPHIEGAEVAAR